ncbi:MAG TPA: hypothetical protein VK970_13180 [Candidatus Methylacidiphilales bacterium]|nr:hypothetical protein [Candidatus Methylacidiphilales bacterium]
MEITPQMGIGRLMLGMSRDDARRALPGLRDKSRKILKIQIFEDYSEEDGVEVHYMDGKDGKSLTVMTICLYAPARPWLFGRLLLGMSYDDASIWMEKLDPASYEEEESIYSPTHGLELYAANLAEDRKTPITSVSMWDPSNE